MQDSQNPWKTRGFCESRGVASKITLKKILRSMKNFCYGHRQTHRKFDTISAVEVLGNVSGGRTTKTKISEEAKQDSIEAIRELHGNVSSSF